jgi:hypothetical protein
MARIVCSRETLSRTLWEKMAFWLERAQIVGLRGEEKIRHFEH